MRKKTAPPKDSILFVGNFLSKQGSSRQYIEEMADRLQERGWQVIRTSQMLFRPFRLIDMIFTVLAHKNQYSMAQIDVFSGPAFLWAEMTAWILRCLKKPFNLLLHGGNLPAFGQRWPRRVRHLFHSADSVVVPSQYLLDHMKPYRSDLKLLPNSVDISAYSFRPRLRPHPNLIWLRSFHKIYNPQLAPLVIARLQETYPEIRLTMVGPDKGDGTLQVTWNCIEELNLVNKIEIIPGIPKEQVPSMLAQADIFINTTNIDNMPVSIIEAMACGLCIVSTNVGGIPYLLKDGEDALLVSPNDPCAMAAAVERILTEPNLAKKLSQNARHKAEQFDWSVVLPKWESLFLEAINNKESGQKKL